jgi:pimeloyl-ACP methyl ester carboxylesterase
MPPPPARKLFAFVVALHLLLLAGCAHHSRSPDPTAEIGFVALGPDVKLRRMVVRNPQAKGTVLFLHGFPETLYAWKDVALILGRDYEVHAFDWPGYGLSTRPAVDSFSYSPMDYARVLKGYIEQSGIATSTLVIYATDIGALPSLLLALEEPRIARKIIVGDFAPFDRPQYMQDNLQALKSKPSSDLVHAAMNRNRDEILENAFRRGLSAGEQFELSREFRDDIASGWSQDSMTVADAFHHYYSHLTRDQDFFESQLPRLKTPVKVVWGEQDFYIKKEMGIEFARKIDAPLDVLPGIGHYPHLQIPRRTIEEIHSAFAGR